MAASNKRFIYFFTKETQNCPVTGIGGSPYSGVIIRVKGCVYVDVHVIGHGSSDGPRQVCHHLAFETVQSCNGVAAKLLTIAGDVLGQNTETVPCASSEELATCKIAAVLSAFHRHISFSPTKCQDGVKLITQLLNPFSGVAHRRKTCFLTS